MISITGCRPNVKSTRSPFDNSEVGKLSRVIPRNGRLVRDGNDECLPAARISGKAIVLSHMLPLTLMNNLERIPVRIEDIRGVVAGVVFHPRAG